VFVPKQKIKIRLAAINANITSWKVRFMETLLLVDENEPTPMPGQPLLCKLGLHKVEALNEHVQRIEDGVWFDKTYNRCSREDCPQSLWWVCVDVEKAYHQLPYDSPARHL